MIVRDENITYQTPIPHGFHGIRYVLDTHSVADFDPEDVIGLYFGYNKSQGPQKITCIMFHWRERPPTVTCSPRLENKVIVRC